MKYRARRRVTTFDVSLKTEFGERQAEIVDATADGARIRLRCGKLEAESNVTVLLSDRPYSARVVWSGEGEAGLAFERSLPPEVLASVQRHARRPVPGKKHRFLMN